MLELAETLLAEMLPVEFSPIVVKLALDELCTVILFCFTNGKNNSSLLLEISNKLQIQKSSLEPFNFIDAQTISDNKHHQTTFQGTKSS